MAIEIRDEILQRITQELLHTAKTEEEIIDGIVSDTYLNRYEASLLYVEAIINIVDTIREIGAKERQRKRKK